MYHVPAVFFFNLNLYPSRIISPTYADNNAPSICLYGGDTTREYYNRAHAYLAASSTTAILTATERHRVVPRLRSSSCAGSCRLFLADSWHSASLSHPISLSSITVASSVSPRTPQIDGSRGMRACSQGGMVDGTAWEGLWDVCAGSCSVQKRQNVHNAAKFQRPGTTFSNLSDKVAVPRGHENCCCFATLQ